MENVAETVSVFSDLSVIVPCSFLIVLAGLFITWTKQTERKQDKDREEHVAKWASMISLFEKKIAAQGEWTEKMMAAHKDEIERQFKLCERNTMALEALTQKVAILIRERSE